jgi:hypothetical protein
VKPQLLLRIAAVITFLFAAGHTLGGVHSWSPGGETEVLKAMRTFRFNAEGATRTYLDFYRGFGFLLSTSMFLQGVLLWQLGTLAQANATQARPMTAAILLASVMGAILSWEFIFPLPVAFFCLVAVLLAASYFATGRIGSAERAIHLRQSRSIPGSSS